MIDTTSCKSIGPELKTSPERVMFPSHCIQRASCEWLKGKLKHKIFLEEKVVLG